MSELALCARGLEKRFGAVIALRGVDLEIETGTVQAVVGPNGAGKSTLLRILAGLSHPSRGEVWLRGRRGDEQAPGKAREEVGYVGHASFVYPELSARENLLFVARLYGLPNAELRADRLLEEEGLSGAADRKAGGFSRGMTQRLAIARSLIHDPRLILLDEPFTGLDRRAADRLTERLQRLRDEGRSLVLISHDFQQIGALSDRTHFLVRGAVRRIHDNRNTSRDELEQLYLQVLDDATNDPQPGDVA